MTNQTDPNKSKIYTIMCQLSGKWGMRTGRWGWYRSVVFKPYRKQQEKEKKEQLYNCIL